MKASFCFFLLLLSVLGVSAQTSNLIIFSDDGQSFTAYVNGEQINSSPKVNVKKTDINAEGVKVRIVFKNPTPELSKYVMLTPGEEMTLGIVKNKKGEYTFKMISSAPVPQLPPGNEVVYADEPVNPSYTENNTIVASQTTTMNNQSVNMAGVTISGGNVNVSINAPVVTTSSTVTTTSSSTSSTNYDQSHGGNNHNGNNSPSRDGHHGHHDSYHDWDNCQLGNREYENATNSIRSKSFSDSKMTLAKQILKANCVTTSQVKGFAQLFDYETDKLSFLKFAYDYTLDKQNYYKVNDVFTYETSIDELNKYLETKN